MVRLEVPADGKGRIDIFVSTDKLAVVIENTVEDIVESGETVWARSRATGNDPRSGKPVSIYVIDICRFENGKLVEHWGVPDRLALLH